MKIPRQNEKNTIVLITVLISVLQVKGRNSNGRSFSQVEISRLRGMVETDKLMEMVTNAKSEVAQEIVTLDIVRINV